MTLHSAAIPRHYYPVHEALENVCTYFGCLRSYWERTCIQDASSDEDDDDEAAAVCIEIKKTPDGWRRLLELEKESARVGKVSLYDFISNLNSTSVGDGDLASCCDNDESLSDESFSDSEEEFSDGDMIWELASSVLVRSAVQPRTLEAQPAYCGSCGVSKQQRARIFRSSLGMPM